MINNDDMIEYICKLKMFSTLVPRYKDATNDCIDRILDKIVKQRRSLNLYELSDRLSNILERDLTMYGSMVINDHRVFKDFIIELRNKTTAQVNIQTVLRKLSSDVKNTGLNHDALKYYYDLFSKERI